MHSAANLPGHRKTAAARRRTTKWPLLALPLLLIAAALVKQMLQLIPPIPPSQSKTLIINSPNNNTNKHNNNNNKIVSSSTSPYHNWQQFSLDYQQMLRHFKIFIYPDVHNFSSPYSNIFVPNPNSSESGNYYSEHAFKHALLRSSIFTRKPEQADMFFMPFSINAMRNDRRVRYEEAISDFVAKYVGRISGEFGFWNASDGADHFYVCCHSVGREAVSKHWGLYNNAIQVTCSSSYFQRFFVAHKDVALPQVWPRAGFQVLNPPHARTKLVFFAGRIQNSPIRQRLLELWGNDSSMDIFSGSSPFSYDEGFKQSKYCLHVKGYEVNTARVSDAIHYGCIPVLISNYYDLPFANILDWTKFSIIINHADIVHLKYILLAIPSEMYESMYKNLLLVRRHFIWHSTPNSYDSFYMTAHQLWLRRGLQRVANY